MHELHRSTEPCAVPQANIMAAAALAETIKTSFGPKGMDKVIVGPDGDITVTNDGATIVEKMQVPLRSSNLREHRKHVRAFPEVLGFRVVRSSTRSRSCSWT